MASAGDSSTTEGKRSSKSVEEPVEAPVVVLELPRREWASYAESFDTSPQMVYGALEADRLYTRDQAAAAINTFLSAPAEKE
jgi:hypothetical protein